MDIFDLFEKLSSTESSLTVDKNNTTLSEKIAAGYIAFENWWHTMYPKICEAIINIKSPEYTAAKREELIKCYKKWGEYGWTFNALTSLATFSELPLSLQDADQKMMQYCTLDNVSSIANKLIDNNVNKEDLEEALFCFENGKYKASSLIIFALIDRELISKGYRRTYKDNKREGNYKTGCSAIYEYQKQNIKAYEKSFIVAYLYFSNIIETLITLFKNSNNFTNETDIVNRNFISHGMSNHIVKEIDCFKVWSALYSLVAIPPKLEELKKDYK